MPYITQDRRDLLDPYVGMLAVAMEKMSAGTGDLNYVITQLALSMKASNYTEMSAIRAVFHDAHDEYYRRRMVDYEIKKARLNGDVY